MIFTVFQYISFLEEETNGHTTELAKKSSEDDTSGDDNDETNDEDDALNNYFSFNFNAVYIKTHPFLSNKEDYNSVFQKINIPPPKI
jgi:hypothetical protein